MTAAPLAASSTQCSAIGAGNASANGLPKVMLSPSPGTGSVSHLGEDTNPSHHWADGRGCCATPHLALLPGVGLHRNSPWLCWRSLRKWGFSSRIWSCRLSQQGFPYSLKQNTACESCITKGGKCMEENGNWFVSQQDTRLTWPLLRPTGPIFLLFFHHPIAPGEKYS